VTRRVWKPRFGRKESQGRADNRQHQAGVRGHLASRIAAKGIAVMGSVRKADRVSGCSLLRPSLWSELLLNRRRHEVHEYDVVRYAVDPEATVKFLRDPGRQLRQRFFGLRHQTSCLFVLRSRWTAGTTPPPATAPIVLRLGPCRRNAAEQRLDCRAHLLFHQVADDRHEALPSRHRVLLSGG